MAPVTLVASLIVHNEMGRYLKPCISSLQEFCDDIRVLDDASGDGSYEWLREQGVSVIGSEHARFFIHEGNARNELLRWTLKAEPTHVLAIDADEFVSDGRALRQAVEHHPENRVWTLKMEEVWKADENSLWIRQDGGWHAHETTSLWRVPEQMPMDWRIADKALACGREPEPVREMYRKSVKTGQSILHFGWANEAGRSDRYQRYVTHDGGEFHANQHIQSIMYPDNRVRLQGRPWPESLIGLRADLLQRVLAPSS
jgi:glycosyltransferase involved in cell wall biosynthesis